VVTKLLLVGIGGFGGAICRYLAGNAVYALVSTPWIPYGTMFVNVLGCLLIGLLGGLGEARDALSPEFRLVVIVGILGGFTTFSTFGYEGFQLLRAGHMLAAIVYAAVQLVAGLMAVWGGFALAMALWAD
jgi:CrcB protein